MSLKDLFAAAMEGSPEEALDSEEVVRQQPKHFEAPDHRKTMRQLFPTGSSGLTEKKVPSLQELRTQIDRRKGGAQSQHTEFYNGRMQTMSATSGSGGQTLQEHNSFPDQKSPDDEEDEKLLEFLLATKGDFVVEIVRKFLANSGGGL